MMPLFLGIKQTELVGRVTHEASFINGLDLWLGASSPLLVQEAELKQNSNYTELRRQRSEFEAAEVVGVCRTGYLKRGSFAKINVVYATELLCVFYHNKKKPLFLFLKRGGEFCKGWGRVTKSLHWEFTTSP